MQFARIFAAFIALLQLTSLAYSQPLTPVVANNTSISNLVYFTIGAVLFLVLIALSHLFYRRSNRAAAARLAELNQALKE